jgi:ubiquinone/menaquinone biosynthesis C-methylase UbiE
MKTSLHTALASASSLGLVFSGLRDFVIQEFLLIYLTVLEIGTFIGFSTMGWSSAVGPDGHVTALEFSPEYAAIAKEAFAKNGIKNVDIVVGDATES